VLCEVARYVLSSWKRNKPINPHGLSVGML
jgi:hypothetical protein